MQPAQAPPKVLTTAQFAEAIGHKARSIRTQHHRKGEAFGIRPHKVGRLLLWPAAEVAALFKDRGQRAA